jgi:hypothetical protein
MNGDGQYGEEQEQVATVSADGSVVGVGQESIVDAADAAPALETRSQLAVAFAAVVWAGTTYVVRLLTAK